MVVDKPTKLPYEYEPNANEKNKKFLAGEFRFVSNKEERLKVSPPSIHLAHTDNSLGVVSARGTENSGVSAKHEDSDQQVRCRHDEPASQKTPSRAGW